MLRPLGHVGLFAGLYVAAASVSLGQLSGLVIVPPPLELLALLLLATAAYTLDRVKLRDAWIDPADVSSQPERYGFLRPRSRAVRVLAFLMLLTGGALGLMFTHWAPLAALLIPLGVAAYAARPRGRRPRPKDVIGIKNLYVAAGIVGFAALSVAAVGARVDSMSGWIEVASANAVALAAAGALLGVRVVLDAALCDIDDAPADKQFGTATLASTFGVRRAWLSTGWARLALIGAIPLAYPCPWRSRLVWLVVTALGTLALRLARPSQLRDWVDLRLPAEAALASALLWVWGVVGG